MKHMRRIIMVGILSVTLAAGAAPAIADTHPQVDPKAAAQASAVQGSGPTGTDVGTKAFNDCPENTFCLWDNREGGGLLLAAVPPLDAHWRLTSASNNRANSVWNRTPYYVVLYDESCPEGSLRVNPGDRRSDLGSIGRVHCDGTWNNKIDGGWFTT